MKDKRGQVVSEVPIEPKKSSMKIIIITILIIGDSGFFAPKKLK